MSASRAKIKPVDPAAVAGDARGASDVARDHRKRTMKLFAAARRDVARCNGRFVIALVEKRVECL